MVYDSWKWKTELREKKRQLLQYNTKKNFDNDFEGTHFKVERALLYSAFIIRILIESEKLSSNADMYNMNVSYYIPKKNIDRLHRWVEEDEYDWNNTISKTIIGKNICNWLIHSYVFNFSFEENGSILGFLVSSDYDRNKGLYSISLEEWLKFIDFVISDDIISVSSHFDTKKADYIIKEKIRGDIQIK